LRRTADLPLPIEKTLTQASDSFSSQNKRSQGNPPLRSLVLLSAKNKPNSEASLPSQPRRPSSKKKTSPAPTPSIFQQPIFTIFPSLPSPLAQKSC
jgi:hypothetical protein